MITTYTYSIATDFSNASDVDLPSLTKLIDNNVAFSYDVKYCSRTGDDVSVVFPSQLSNTQESELANVISEYIYIEPTQPTVSNSQSCVVSKSATNPGDYTSVSAAFAAGELSVYVKNGMYYETADIVVPDSGQLIGESTGGVYIVLLAGSRIISDGSGGVVETAGTISVAYNTLTVTGVGTTFTNLTNNVFILIGTNYYKIESVESDTSLTLGYTYTGASVTGNTYRASSMNTGVVMRNLVVTSSISHGMYLRGLRNSVFSSIVITNCLYNVHVTGCGDCSLDHVISYIGNSHGIYIEDSISISLNTINLFNNKGHGAQLINNVDVLCVTCASENNDGCGVYMIDGMNNGFTNCIFKSNTSSGFYNNATSKFTNLSNCNISRNQVNGIVADGENNLISCCDTVNNVGDGVVIAANCNQSIICNNIVRGSTTGITIETGATDIIVTGNMLKNNSTGLVDNGVGTVTNNNIV